MNTLPQMMKQDTPADYSLPPLPIRRENNVTFIRWILAVMVVFAHSWGMANLTTPFAFLSHRQGLTEGAIALDAFFLLSGYLILQSREHSACTCDFFRRRILRIYPGYLALSLIGIALFWHAINLTMVQTLATLQPLPIAPFTGNWSPEWDGQMWSVCYEGLCYALLAGLWAIGGFRSPWPIIALTVGVLSYHLLHVRQPLEWQDPYRFFAYFAIGCLYYQFRAVLLKPNTILFGAAVAVLVIATALPWFTPFKDPLNYALPIALPYVLFHVALNFRPVKWIKDDLSYGTYCWAWPITSAILWLTGSTCPPLVTFAVTMAVVTPLALASWRYVEKPALAFKRYHIPHLLIK